MIAPSYTFASTQSNVAPQQLAGVDLAFVGGSVDDRGSATIDALKNASGVISGLRYDPDDQNIYLDGQPSKRSRLAEHMEDAKRILIDATTLGLGEILNILMAIQIRRGSMVEFLYAEPGEYTKSKPADDEEPQHRKFALTTNCRFQAIHGYAHAYQANMLARHVFFLGYESARVRNAIEQRGDIDRARYQIQVVIGVPAFQAGWEANTIRTHLHVLEDLEVADHRIAYCQANSVRESYLTLWDLYRQLGDERSCFYISPLGTKPHTVATALFLLETRGNNWTTSLYYDHPERVSNRSSGYSTWHHVTVQFPSPYSG
jgi:hypothetical protein